MGRQSIVFTKDNKSVVFTKEERELVYYQLFGRIMYFEELMKEEMDRGNIERVHEISSQVAKIQKAMNKLLV